MRIIIALVFILSISCQDRLKNFESLDPNVHFKLYSFGEGSASLSSVNYIEIEYNYCEDELCSGNELNKTAYADLSDVACSLNKFNLNDAFVLILDSLPSSCWMELLELDDKLIFWPVIAKVKITKALNEKSKGVKEEDEALWMYREKREIERLKSDTTVSYVAKGQCYIGIERHGTGDTILDGRKVVLSYKGYFSNGKLFDDTDNWKDSVDFIYGQPFQLIAGLEAGIHGLREGAEAKIIIPSHLAFGKHGSSSGIVPPFEPLLYNVKIISVKQPFL